MAQNKQLILITNIPNHYRIPLFNELNRQVKELGWELLVVFGAPNSRRRKTTVDLSECNFNYTILKPGLFSPVERQTGLLFYSGLLRFLHRESPHLIIVSGFSVSAVKVWFKSLYSSVTYHIISGSTENASKHGIVRKFMRKVLAKRASGFIAYGTLAKEYLMNLGAKKSQIICMGNTVDTSFFQLKTKESRKQKPVSEVKHLTYVGYINRRKNVQELIWVLKEAVKFRQDIVLNIVGDGEELESLKTLVAEEKLVTHVTFHGFIQKEGLPEILAISDVFLFQTDHDIWGLVLNEAMAAGVPCFASVNAGATHDLIKEGETGYCVDFSDHVGVAKKIVRLLDNPDEMERVALNASRIVNRYYSLVASAQRITKILNT